MCTQACFLVDALTYVVAAWCASLVPPALGDPAVQAKQLAKTRSMAIRSGSGGAATKEVELEAQGEGEGGACVAASASGLVHHARRHSAEYDAGGSGGGHGLRRRSAELPEPRHASSPATRPGSSSGDSDGGGGCALGRYAVQHKASDGQEHVAAAEVDERGLASKATEAHPAGAAAGVGSEGLTAAAAAAWREGLRAFFEGSSYLRSAVNRDVAAMVREGTASWRAR